MVRDRLQSRDSWDDLFYYTVESNEPFAGLGIDPNRIAVWGGSAGAITAGTIGWVADEGASSNNTMHFSSKIAAAVGISGCLWPFFV